jgi:adenylate cyclase
LRLTIQARTLILVILGLLFVTRIPWPESGYYLLFVVAFALVGGGQLFFAKTNHPKIAAWALLLDAVIVTYMLFAPNPWTDPLWPSATIYKFDGWRYLFVFLAAATIGHSWRVVLAFGIWTGLVWLTTAGIVSAFGKELPAITRQLSDALESASLARVLDPNRIFWSARVADAVVFALVALILAVNAWRLNRLVLVQAELARQRSNLSRHFAPSMVELMANRDKPFGDVRSQEVVIVFADIVGFTTFAERNPPEETIRLLGQFHARVESIIFKHEGTLDKFLGDGVMASFGTPLTRQDDSDRALRCVAELIKVELPVGLSISVGAHRGKVVLGDVGSERRLEFATIGDTVNVAARLEGATRKAGVRALVSDALMQDAAQVGKFEHSGPLKLRGRKEAMVVWELR